MKVSIIGGGGLVGSSAAYALQCGGAVSHICLIDANKDAALGHATELLHGACLTADQRITAGDMSDVSSSNIVVITAGLRRKPEESRLDRVPPEQIEALLGEGSLMTIDQKISLSEALQSHWSQPIELLPLLMIVILLVLAVECLLANKFYRHEPQEKDAAAPEGSA